MRYLTFFLFVVLIMTACTNSKSKYPDVQPPVAAIEPFELKAKHGHARTDDYYWLKNREDQRVIDYLTAENRYLDTLLAHTKPLREKLFAEMKGRIKERDESVPYRLDDFYYYNRFEVGFEYPIYCRKKGALTAPEEIVANGNEIGKAYSFFSFFIAPSPGHQVMALVMDTVGRRFYTIKFKDMATGNMLPDEIGNTSGNLAWTEDSKTVYYTKQDPNTLRTYLVYKHVLGTNPAQDVLIYEEKDETLSVSVSKSRSKKFFLLTSGRTDASYVQFFETGQDKKLSLIEPLKPNTDYYADHFRDRFYIRTNLDAKNYRLVEAPTATPGSANWKDVVPAQAESFFGGMALFDQFLVIEEEKAGLTRLRIRSWADQSEHSIDFGEAAYVAGIDNNPEANTNLLRFSFQSMTTPPSTFDYHMETKEKTLLKQREVLGGYDPAKYTSERVMVTARDGKQIPLSIVYRKDVKKDGQAPLLQYAYGSYGASMYPYFSISRLSLLDRGFIYAIAHIRGGQEMGGAWYDEGKMLNKKNTFYDFIDCSKYLIDQRYTAADRLFANGGSAGGLLMGAITNMAPELYKGIIAEVPFVDVITTMMDETIPLTTFEWREWGNPGIPEQYEYMLSYSPYDNVEKKAYPNLLVTTGLHDSQVQYWEPAKWVAKLRANKTDNNVLLLYTNMDAGHGGASGRFKALKEDALQYAFILDLMGVSE
jgi:oligopeptidase B